VVAERGELAEVAALARHAGVGCTCLHCDTLTDEGVPGAIESRVRDGDGLGVNRHDRVAAPRGVVAEGGAVELDVRFPLCADGSAGADCDIERDLDGKY
jgi:hypothetical protein